MNQLKAILHTTALKLRSQHKTVDLSILEQALNEGARLAVEAFTQRVKREHSICVAIRNSPNAG